MASRLCLAQRRSTCFSRAAFPAFRMLSFGDIPESGIFDSTFTGVEGGSLRADMRDPAGVAFRTWAPVLEYTTEGGHVVPQPTGLGATVSLSICPLVIWENNPRFCDPPLQIDKVTPDPHRENVALADPGFSVSFSEPIDLATLEAHFRLHTMDADSPPS